ncbi:MAG: site-specific integrase [Actinomycetota bacterium]|nr:site-specific integrase [Actinomycetota bacterium]
MSIEERHSKECASHRGKRCNCVARYRGEVRDATGRKVRSAWSASRAQVTSWEKEAMVAVRHGRLRASTPTTVRQAGIALVAGMRSRAILDRSGKPYKPKTVRGYEHSLDTYIYPLLGSRKVSSLRRADIQGFVEEMRALGAAPSTVHNRLDPLRVIVRRSIDNDELLVDPCARLKMPVVRNVRTRIESSTTAEALIAALPETEQAFWALALFAGIRRGELRGLQVDDIDFDAGLVRVQRGWDDVEGEIDPKTFAGTRDIPMVGELRRICRAHKLQTGRNGTQLFLGRTPADAFYPSTIRTRALKAWGWNQVPNPSPGPPQTIWIKARPDALEPLTPHEARHCAASYMIAAGMDWKKITEFIGHSDVRTTYNRYGKVVPEDLAPAAAQLDEYLDRGRARLESRPQTGGKTGGSVTGLRPPPPAPSG